ncbi:hypothetical protein Cal7507_5441 [Calothrix sp. PCC 7507]|nr:hypothetical protein Cal7507_5441 [Calothrix sp. PCC 7507]
MQRFHNASCYNGGNLPPGDAPASLTPVHATYFMPGNPSTGLAHRNALAPLRIFQKSNTSPISKIHV